MIQLRLYHVMSCQSLAPYIWNYTSSFRYSASGLPFSH
nr:MAG TPA: hypothetical protein [Caudoviricetes sp.]DAY85491.1 MAG TPA: hypothetical protein [Caudoviricetes sp.]